MSFLIRSKPDVKSGIRRQILRRQEHPFLAPVSKFIGSFRLECYKIVRRIVNGERRLVIFHQGRDLI